MSGLPFDVVSKRQRGLPSRLIPVEPHTYVIDNQEIHREKSHHLIISLGFRMKSAVWYYADAPMCPPELFLNFTRLWFIKGILPSRLLVRYNIRP